MQNGSINKDITFLQMYVCSGDRINEIWSNFTECKQRNSIIRLEIIFLHNSTAGAAQVDIHLQEQLSDYLQF